MLKLYHAPRTRSVRIRWLLEELGLPHELVRVEFRPATHVFAQATPAGKFPVFEDGFAIDFKRVQLDFSPIALHPHAYRRHRQQALGTQRQHGLRPHPVRAALAQRKLPQGLH